MISSLLDLFALFYAAIDSFRTFFIRNAVFRGENKPLFLSVCRKKRRSKIERRRKNTMFRLLFLFGVRDRRGFVLHGVQIELGVDVEILSDVECR